MDDLRQLVYQKIERERFYSAGGGSASGGATPTATESGSVAVLSTEGRTPCQPVANVSLKTCWLCAREVRFRYRLKDMRVVCFSCFRIAYRACILPCIDTPARRRSDHDFLNQIYRLQEECSSGASTSQHERGLESGLIMGPAAEVIESNNASFVMSASVMRQRGTPGNGSPHYGSPIAGIAMKGRRHMPDGGTHIDFWQCPRCTFINDTSLRMCDACGFVNTGSIQCMACKVDCPISIGPPKPGVRVSACIDGTPHCVWRCAECTAMNTIDGDLCAICHRPRYWACSQCTAVHQSSRAMDGLRYCSTCGSCNTPDDVVTGQEILDKERKSVQVADTQPETGEGEDGVVFGVNDALTVAEQQRQAEIEANRVRLASRLKRLHVVPHLQEMDGNCLFAALAHQLFGRTALHHLVRSLIVNYMKENAEDYAMLFDGPEEWLLYTKQMRESGFWGDELCLNAAARCFHVNIHVITSDTNRWHLVFQHDKLDRLSGQPTDGRLHAEERAPRSRHGASRSRKEEAPPVGGVSMFLAYQAPVHYDDITPSPVSSLLLSDLLLAEVQKWTDEAHREELMAKGKNQASIRQTAHPTPVVPSRRGPTDHCVSDRAEAAGARLVTPPPCLPARKRNLSRTYLGDI